MTKPYILLVVSLAANAAILGTIIVHQQAQAPPPPKAISIPVVAGNKSRVSSTGLSPADVATLERSRELLSIADPRVLVLRLREAGFSTELVRAIVLAKVGEEFSARRKEAMAKQEVAPFWRSTQDQAAAFGVSAEMRRISREETARYKEILGADANLTDDWSLHMQERRYGKIPQDKIDRLQAITNDYSELRMQLMAESRGMPLADDNQRLALIEKEQRADIEKLFTPQELEEYDLRNGQVASNLRYQLSAFNPTEEEFRTIFRLTQSARAAANIEGTNTSMRTIYGPEGAIMVLSGANGTMMNKAAQAQLQEQIAAALGPARAADYQQANDPSYQQASRLLARLDLPTTLATDVVSVQQDLQSRINTVRKDRTLSQDQIASQLGVLANEAQTRLTTTLGSRGYNAYLQYGGEWLRNLTPPPSKKPKG